MAGRTERGGDLVPRPRAEPEAGNQDDRCGASCWNRRRPRRIPALRTCAVVAGATSAGRARAPPRQPVVLLAFLTVRRRPFARGWPSPNVRGIRPRESRASAAASAAAADANGTSTKLVVDGWTSQPASRSRSVNRSRSAAMAATRDGARFGSRRRAAATSTEMFDTEPGGRYTAISSITSGRASAKPTRRPAIE